MTKRFADKTVLVTGGTSGIGHAAARLFIEEGARVAITGVNAARLQTAADRLGAVGVHADAADVDATRRGVEEAAQALGGFDAVFLNAGAARFAELSAVTEDLFDDLFAINVKGVLFAAQAAAPHLRDGGAIVVNTSVNNRMGMGGAMVYAATKAAARSLVRTLAGELAPRRIRVNAISPGPVETPIYGKLGLPAEQVQAIAAALPAKIPLNRFGQADEIARAALFLASDDAAFVTGAELTADGGWTDVMP